MISKRPIICYAPKDLAVSSFLKDNDVGLTASNEEELTQIINSLLSNNDVYKHYSISAFNYAKKHFSKEYARALFLKYGFEL